MARRAVGSASEARKAFGALLHWHLKRGTRPPGAPALRHTDWSQKEFSGAVKRAGINGEATDRTIRNWCNGATLPNDLRPIERALFGAEPADPNDDREASQRQKLRHAFHLAKNGTIPAKNGTIPQTDLAATLPMPSIVSHPGECFGRDAEIAQLVASLMAAPAGGSALVLGNGGHGKTMLTRIVALQPAIIARFGARRWFAALERAETAEAALSEIAHAIGLDRHRAAWPAIQTALASAPGLLVLDNLETPLHAPRQRAQVEQLLRDLTTVPGLGILASLRSQETVGAVAWTEVVLLEPLPPDVSQAMFLSIARTISAADPDLKFFVGNEGVTGGIPLAIHLVAHRVFRAASLATLRREWGSQGALLAAVSGGEGNRLDSLPASVAFSVASGRLKTVGRRLFSLLGELPSGLSEEDRSAIFGDAGSDAAAQLRSVGLLRDAEDGRIGLLPPVRDIAGRLYALDSTMRLACARLYLGLVAEQGAKAGTSGGQAAVQRLMPEMPNIAAAFNCALQLGEPGAAFGALEGFERALRYTGYRAEPVLDRIEQACRESGDPVALGRCLFTRASGARIRSEGAAAIRLLEEAMSVLKRTAEPVLLGHCLWALGDIARAQDRHEAARGYFKTGQRYFQEAGHAGEGNCLHGLAEIHRMQEQHGAAKAAYSKASAIYRQANLPLGEADCLIGIADMARVRDDADSAEANFRAALILFQQTGWWAGEADSIWGLACVAMMRADHDAARAGFHKALQLHGKAGLMMGVGNCHWGLGEVERMQARLGTAEECYGNAILAFRTAAWPGGLGMAEAGLAKVLPKSRRAEAMRLFERALQAFRQARMLIDEADCLMSMGALLGRAEAMRLCEAARLLYLQAESPVGVRRCDFAWAALADGPAGRTKAGLRANG